MKQRHKVISLLVLLCAAALAVAQALLLPDTVVAQVTSGGEAGNTLPKPVAIAIPLGITIYGTLNYYNDAARSRAMIWAFLGIALAAVTFVMNLSFLNR